MLGEHDTRCHRSDRSWSGSPDSRLSAILRPLNAVLRTASLGPSVGRCTGFERDLGFVVEPQVTVIDLE